MRSRFWACWATWGLAGSLMAQGTFLGAKKEALTNMGPSAPVGILPTLQMVMALGLVIVLVKWLVPGLISRFGKRMVSKVDSPIRVEESANFGSGTLYVVTVRGRTLLLASGASGGTLIADLTEKAQPEPTFMEMVEQSPGTADKAVVEVPEVDVTAALDRLERLVG